MTLRDRARWIAVLATSACVVVPAARPDRGAGAQAVPAPGDAQSTTDDRAVQSSQPLSVSARAPAGPMIATSGGGHWTWVAGSDHSDLGVYGERGHAGATTRPAARMMAASWIDPRGNFWVFGGISRDDLWKYDGARWTWVAGSRDNYQLGNNSPTARFEPACASDRAGNLWLFGGNVVTVAGQPNTERMGNDLWKFDGTRWMLMSGSRVPDARPPVRGKKGVPSAENDPGSRSGAAAFTDARGHFWLFGGVAPSGNTAVFRSDLWRFDGKHWTWVAGSDLPDQPNGDGPGARHRAAVASDDNGNVWLFGGSQYSNWLGDLWKFDGQRWTQLAPSDGPRPDSREAAIAGIDRAGDLWLFGGMSLKGPRAQSLGDLWKFDGTRWTLVSSSIHTDEPPTHGTLGVAGPRTFPGARVWSSGGWDRIHGHLLVYGGRAIDRRYPNQGEQLGDLFQYSP